MLSGREDAFTAARHEEPARPGQQQRAGHQQEQQQQQHAAQAEEQRQHRGCADSQHQQLQPTLRRDRPVEEPVSLHVHTFIYLLYSNVCYLIRNYF